MASREDAIVVGVDGSDAALRAVSWAAAEADRRGSPLHVVLVNDDPARREFAEQAVREAEGRCTFARPHLAVTAGVVMGNPVTELLRQSGKAPLLVLGARGLGGFDEALLGGVSTGVAAHAHCPVVIVREETPTTAGPVVVGVDNSGGSRQALRFAYESAERLRADLVVLQVWGEEGLLSAPLRPEERDRVQREVEASLSDQAAELRARYPQVRTREVVQRGHPVASLTDAARDARLLVVGHRGRGGFGGLFLGSVAIGVLHHARCPVAVVPTG